MIRRREWIIKRPLLAAACAALVAYVLVVESLELYMLGPPHSLKDRLKECLLLWVVICAALGLAQHAWIGRPPRTAAIWPLLIVPIGLTALLAASEAWRVYSSYSESISKGTPSASESFVLYIGIGLIAVWLALGAVTCGGLVGLARMWRQPTAPSHCRHCGHDLTGNVSFRCPACGLATYK